MRIMKLKKAGIVTVAAVSAGVLAGGGVAFAASSSTPQYSACYKSSGSGLKALEWVTTSSKCPSGYTKITWNTTGPKGATGATGAKGATGPVGLPGESIGVTQTVPLNSSPTPLSSAWTQVIDTPAVKVTGAYYVTGDVVVGIKPDDQVVCEVGYPPSGHAATEEYTASNQGSASIWATIPVNAVVAAAVGQSFEVNCVSIGSDDAYEATLNAILISSDTGPDNGYPAGSPVGGILSK
ncbi:MAG: hypothetical protein JWM19_1296 [Actinomycetia bacterium]|nr:hypothetical protein [Actinomycetes bacterium]